MRTIRNISFLILCTSFVISRAVPAVARAEEDVTCTGGGASLQVASATCLQLSSSTCETLCGNEYCGGCSNGEGSCSEEYDEPNLYPFSNPSNGIARDYECLCACPR
jgi:hypothetical protein